VISSLSDLRKAVSRRRVELAAAKQACRDESRSIKQSEKDLAVLEEAQQITQTVAQEVQTKAHSQIAGIVCESLAAIFDDPYEFRIQFERKRGQTEARLVFVREGLEVDPLSAAGGGVVDIAALALRLSCLLLARDRSRVLILDEPLRFLSTGHQDRIRSLLEQLSRDLRVQIVMVLHDEGLRIGRVIDLS